MPPAASSVRCLGFRLRLSASCKEHVQTGAKLEVNMPNALRDKLLSWHKSSLNDKSLPTPTPLWAEAYRICHRNVKYDVFPRYRCSPLCEEAMTLHLRRCLLAASCRDAFTAEDSPVALTPTQKAALQCFVAATDYSRAHTTLASGWPDDASVQEASRVFMASHKQWPEFGIDEQTAAAIRKQLNEAPPTLFHPTLMPCLNAFADVYTEWLDSEQGKAFCKEHIGTIRSLKPKAVKEELQLDTTEDYLSGW